MKPPLWARPQWLNLKSNNNDNQKRREPSYITVVKFQFEKGKMFI